MRASRAVFALCLLGSSRTAAARPDDASHVDTTQVTFAMSRTSHALSAPFQLVFVQRTSGTGGSWKATADKRWLEITPSEGTVPERVRIRLRPETIPGGSDTAMISFSGDQPSPWREAVAVRLRIVYGDAAPIGAVDVPADHAWVRGGRLAVAGWALDDIGLTGIEICRDSHIPDLPACADGRGVRLATAEPYAFGRTDVAAIYPSFPRSEAAGWADDVDTRSWPRDQRGTFPLRVVARDRAGHLTTIGTPHVTVEPGGDPPSAVLTRALLLPPIALLLLLLLHGAALTLTRRAPEHPAPAASHIPATAPDRWIALGIASAATALALRSAAGGLTYDELFTYARFVEGASLWQSATGVGVFNNHVANSILANLSVRVFGATEWALRLPAALLGAVGIYSVWRLTRDLASTTTALLAAALFALSPMQQE